MLYSFKLSVGQTAFAGKPIYSNEAIAAFLEDKNVNLHFFRYSSSFIIENAQTNIYNAKILNQDLINNALVPFPPLPEQQKISAHLDIECAKIDDVITKTKATIEEYKKLKQSVITEAVTKGVRGDRTMKDSGVEYNDFIPCEWNEAKLKYLVYLRARLGWRGLKADEYVDNGFIFLSAFNIINNKLDFSEVNYINQFRYDESPEIKLNLGDVLIVKDGAGIGKCAYVDYMPKESTPNGSLAVITPNDKLYGKYLYYYFLSSMFQERILQLKDGMGVPHLFQGDMREILIPVSNVEEQQEIANYLDKKCTEIDRLIECKQKLLAELENYKKSVIYEYVTGKREVCDINGKEENVTIFDPQAARLMQAALVYKVIKQSGNDLKGRIHLMKLIYMLDCMLGLGLGINYLRYTRGPYNPIIESIEKNLSDKGIISVNTAKNYSYTVIDDSFDSKYNELFAKHNSEIEKIIDYMKRMKSSRAEKIATLYAAWNDMVIDGVQNITDKMIIDDVMNNWTENKAKTDFSTWQHILNDMKDKKIIPHGYGKHTRPRSE